jgi:hypothetical protein
MTEKIVTSGAPMREEFIRLQGENEMKQVVKFLNKEIEQNQIFIYEYYGPDLAKYVQRSSNGIFRDDTYRKYVQELIFYPKRTLYRTERNGQHKNRQINNSSENSPFYIQNREKSQYYDIKNGDRRGRHALNVNQDSLINGIVKVEAFLNNRMIETTLNSREDISFISLKEVKLAKLKFTSNNIKATISFYNGKVKKIYQVLGHVQVKLKFSLNATYNVTLPVIKQKFPPLSLGREFLIAAGITFSSEKKTVMDYYENEISILTKKQTMPYFQVIKILNNQLLDIGETMQICHQLPKRRFTRYYYGTHHDDHLKLQIKHVRSENNKSWVIFEVKNITDNYLCLHAAHDLIKVFISKKELLNDKYHTNIERIILPYGHHEDYKQKLTYKHLPYYTNDEYKTNIRKCTSFNKLYTSKMNQVKIISTKKALSNNSDRHILRKDTWKLPQHEDLTYLNAKFVNHLPYIETSPSPTSNYRPSTENEKKDSSSIINNCETIQILDDVPLVLLNGILKNESLTEILGLTRANAHKFRAPTYLNQENHDYFNAFKSGDYLKNMTSQAKDDIILVPPDEQRSSAISK